MKIAYVNGLMNIRQCIILSIRHIYYAMIRLRVVKPKVIVFVDGGICSQILQYLNGQTYAINGYDVGYDLYWYKSDGFDLEHKCRRLYELQELFPNLCVHQFNQITTSFYRTFLRYNGNYDKISSKSLLQAPPVYIAGRYVRDADDFRFLLKRCILERNPISIPVLPAREGQYTCAIHIRRGDLANGTNVYYGGVSDKFFFNAIEYIEKNHPQTKYFLFSDDIAYVKNEIVTKLEVEYCVVDDPKASIVLKMMAACNVIVASQGSLGKMAAMLNERSTLIMQSYNKEGVNDYHVQEWRERIGDERVILISGI